MDVKRMALKHEALGRFSQQQVAAFAGVNQRTVRKWGLEPDDTEDAETYYIGKDVKAFWEKQAFDRGYSDAMGKGAAFDENGDSIDVELEKARKLKAERIGQEIKNAQALGELAPVDILVAALGDTISHMNTHLESVPAIIKRIWPEVPGHVLDSIDRGMAQLRSSIADARINWTLPEMAGGGADGGASGDAGATDGAGGFTADRE